jgi:competence protein CoiA
MDAHVPDLRPDASGRVRGQPLAIEVQASALGVDAILQRTQAYTRRKVAILWVLPRNEPPPGDALATRLHERYLHSMYLGRVYYWWPGLGGTVLPVHFGPATRDMPGGYEAAYRAIRTPWCAPRLDIGQDFQPFRRPAGQLWVDRLKPWW